LKIFVLISLDEVTITRLWYLQNHILLKSDNTCAIDLPKNPVWHSRTKTYSPYTPFHKRSYKKRWLCYIIC